MTTTNKRQIQGRGYPYLIFDTAQHKHLRMDGILEFQIHKQIVPLDSLLRQQMMYWLSVSGVPTIRAATTFLDAQYVDATIEGGETGHAKVSFYFVEQLRIGGFYVSDRVPTEHLRAACEDSLRHHFNAFNFLVQKRLRWMTFGTLKISHIEHYVGLTNELKTNMEQAESDYWDLLQRTVHDDTWSVLAPLRKDSHRQFLNALEHYAHGSVIHEEELMDYGLVPQGRKLTFNQSDGAPAMDVYGLVKADSRAKVPLSYVVLHDQNSGFVVSRDIDELDQMALADFTKKAPPTRPDLDHIATEPTLTAAPALQRGITPQQPGSPEEGHEQN